MKKLFLGLFIFSLAHAMQIVVARQDGRELKQSELQQLAALSSFQIQLINTVLWVPNPNISKENNTEIARKIEQKKATLITIIQNQYLQQLRRAYQLYPYAHNLHDLIEKEKKNSCKE